MANYLSSPYQPNNPRTDENFGLLAQVAQMRQQKYDANKTQLQQTLDAYGGIQLLRPEDQDYLASKLTSIVNTVNTAGNRDLSQSGVADELLTTVKTAVYDPIISNAIENTTKVQNFQKQVAQIREKKPELYSDINYNYALEDAGLSEYMAGRRSKIGNLQYTNYSDYNKKLNDLIIDLESKKKDQVIQISDNQGRIYEKTISGLSPVELRRVAESMLDVNDVQQIKIDGWYAAGGYNNPTLTTEATNYVNSKIKNNNTEINLLNKKLKEDTLSEEEKASVNNRIDILSGQKAELEKNIKLFESSPNVAATYLQQEKVFGDVVSRFSPIYTESSRITKDDAYWAEKNYQMDERKFALDVAKFDYEKQKDEAKLIAEQPIVTTQGTGDLESSIDSAEQEVNTKITEIGGQLDTTLQQYKNKLEEKAASGNRDAANILELYNERLNNKKANQTDLDIFRAVVTETDSTNDSLAIIDGVNYKANIRELVDDYDLYLAGRNQAQQQAKLSHIDSTLNSPETLRAFYDNPEIKMMYDGKAVPVKDVLISKGIINNKGIKTGDIKKDAKLLSELEQSFYADAILSATADNSRTTNWVALRKLSALFGENPNTVVTGGSQFGDAVSINPNTKTGAYLLRARQNKIYDTSGFWDNSLTEDSTIKKFLDQDYTKSIEYKQSLAKFRDKLPNNQTIGISPAQERDYKRIQALASSVDNTFRPTKESTLNLRDDGDYIEVSATNFYTKDGAESPQTKTVRILKQDFQRNLPNLSAGLNFAAQSAIYTADKLQGRPLISPSVQYMKNSGNDNYEWAANILLRDKPQLTGYLMASDAKTVLKTKHAAYAKRNPEVNSVIDTAVANSSNFGVSLELSSNFGNPKMFIKLQDKNTKDVIHTLKVENRTDADQFKPILDNAPQVYYSMLIDDILQKQAMTPEGQDFDPYSDLKQSLKLQ